MRMHAKQTSRGHEDRVESAERDSGSPPFDVSSGRNLKFFFWAPHFPLQVDSSSSKKVNRGKRGSNGERRKVEATGGEPRRSRGSSCSQGRRSSSLGSGAGMSARVDTDGKLSLKTRLWSVLGASVACLLFSSASCSEDTVVAWWQWSPFAQLTWREGNREKPLLQQLESRQVVRRASNTFWTDRFNNVRCCLNCSTRPEIYPSTDVCD